MGSDITLNVNDTGAYPIYYNGKAYDENSYDVSDGDSVYLTFDGEHWNITDEADVAKEVATYTTDADGYIESGELLVQTEGYYFLKETKASEGYSLDTGYYKIYVRDTETIASAATCDSFPPYADKVAACDGLYWRPARLSR